MDLHEIFKTFQTEWDYHDYLIARRWPNGMCCTNCGSKKVYKRRTEMRMKCGDCNHSFSATCGTLFHHTKMPLSKWFIAISMIVNAKKGLSSLQLARTINVNKNTAWLMQMKLRAAMSDDPTLYGMMNSDEAGEGKAIREKEKRLCVISLAEKRKLKPYLLKRTSVNNFMISNVQREDGINNYLNSYSYTHLDYPIKSLKQGSYDFLSATGFFSMIKRAIIGQYHQIQSYNLNKYMDEINFKYHHRKNDLFEVLIYKMLGRGATF